VSPRVDFAEYRGTLLEGSDWSEASRGFLKVCRGGSRSVTRETPRLRRTPSPRGGIGIAKSPARASLPVLISPDVALLRKGFLERTTSAEHREPTSRISKYAHIIHQKVSLCWSFSVKPSVTAGLALSRSVERRLSSDQKLLAPPPLAKPLPIRDRGGSGVERSRSVSDESKRKLLSAGVTLTRK
jgi:hypothetical protein